MMEHLHFVNFLRQNSNKRKHEGCWIWWWFKRIFLIFTSVIFSLVLLTNHNWEYPRPQRFFYPPHSTSDFNEGRSAVDEVQFRITLSTCLSMENGKFCEVYTTKVNLVPRVLFHFLINRKTRRNYQKRPWVRGWKKVRKQPLRAFLKNGCLWHQVRENTFDFTAEKWF